MTEQQLIADLKTGRENAYEFLVKNYQNKVYNTALSMLQNEDDAMDTAQNVFIEVYKSIANFRLEASLNTWIYKLTVNKCLEEIRKKKRKKRFAFLTSIFDADTEKELRQQSDFIHPGIELEKKEYHHYLNKAIKLLPEMQQTALLLHKIEGLSHQEVAIILDKSVSSVESLIFRAKQQLKVILIKQIDQYQ
ncbi:RNA polymerase sigma factor [Pelobium sp.]|nr:RNA polymerase sigma factor [Pelobium sp.]MDA9555613.1 RNA polymerase sigma factor [Pelobium sp.]